MTALTPAQEAAVDLCVSKIVGVLEAFGPSAAFPKGFDVEGPTRSLVQRLVAETGGIASHYVASSPGKVGVTITQSTQGVTLEADVDRPRAPGEPWETAVAEAARLAGMAFAAGIGEIVALGMTPGKVQTKEVAR